MHRDDPRARNSPSWRVFGRSRGQRRNATWGDVAPARHLARSRTPRGAKTCTAPALSHVIRPRGGLAEEGRRDAGCRPGMARQLFRRRIRKSSTRANFLHLPRPHGRNAASWSISRGQSGQRWNATWGNVAPAWHLARSRTPRGAITCAGPGPRARNSASWRVSARGRARNAPSWRIPGCKRVSNSASWIIAER